MTDAARHKDYIGDGVYVDVQNGMLKLTTENGINTENTIFLEPDVFQSLLRYVERMQKDGVWSG